MTSTWTSTTIGVESKGHKYSSKACRLCMNGDSPLVNVYAEEHLHRWISDFLSITISTGDRMSQAICAACRTYLTEFVEFRKSCHEVQRMLQSTIRDEKDEAEGKLSEQRTHHAPDEFEHDGGSGMSLTKRENTYRENHTEVQQTTESNLDVAFEIKAEPYEEDDSTTGSDELLEPQNATVSFTEVHTFEQDAEGEQPIYMDDDMIETQDVKIETHSDDGGASDAEFSEQYQSSDSSIAYEKKKRSNKKTIKCDKCQEICRTKVHLHHHNLFVHNPKSHKCHPCELAFVHQTNLLKHERSRKHLKRLRALKLSNNYKVKVNDQHNNEAPKEAQPGEEFIPGVVPNTNELTSNDDPTRAKVANDGDRQWKCDICDKSFTTYVNLYNHKRTHSAPRHICPICGRPILKRVNLKRHMNTHEIKPKQKPAPCKRVDVNILRPFKCDICPSTFRMRSALYNHKVKVHGPRIHPCSVCDIRFPTRYDMLRHQKSHNRA